MSKVCCGRYTLCQNCNDMGFNPMKLYGGSAKTLLRPTTVSSGLLVDYTPQATEEAIVRIKKVCHSANPFVMPDLSTLSETSPMFVLDSLAKLG